MYNKQIIQKTAKYVIGKLERSRNDIGHDWWHTKRVRQTAKYISSQEGGNLFVVELAALLHDVADWKFHDGDEKMSSRLSKGWLEYQGIRKPVVEHVCHIIDNISFKGAGESNKIKTIEGKIVQDADRLDALGAIGIARAFAFAGHMKNPIYDPQKKLKQGMKFSAYKKSVSPAINHFYEKLLLLKDKMNTETGKEIAGERHNFMKQYLEIFFKEWEGRK